MDVDRLRPLDVADASLRAMGHVSESVVLDTGELVGAGVGVVGVRARVRQLVPTRLRRPTGGRLLQ